MSVAMPVFIPIGTETMEALRFLLDGSLTETPKHQSVGTVAKLNDLAWVFVAGPDFLPQPARMYETLEKKLPGATYFAPNTFFSRRSKDKNSLRWMNCFFVDIDSAEMSILDVLDAVRYAGLPDPSMINKTPHGWHVYWRIERVRATSKAVWTYEKIQREIVTAIGSDPMAAGAEHLMRIPSSVVNFTRNTYMMQDFFTWADINIPEWRAWKRPGTVVTTGAAIMAHPAIQALLAGVEEGRRNNTCFTLALCFLAAGYTKDQAMSELMAWNFSNRPPLPVSNVRACVNSAYSGKYHGPSARAITELSGIEFHHRAIRRESNGGSKRDQYISQTETRTTFLTWLQDQGGQVTTTQSQKQISADLKVKYRSLCQVIADLQSEGTLSVETRRLGRGKTETTYVLVSDEPVVTTTGHHARSRSNVIDLDVWRARRFIRNSRKYIDSS